MASSSRTLPLEKEILERIRRHESVLHPLPGGGVLSIDRELPYLLVHRSPPGREDPGTAVLVSGESSYLLSGSGQGEDVVPLVRHLAETGSGAYGAFLVLEIWSSEDPRSGCFTLHGPEGPAPETLGTLAGGLRSLRDLHPDVEVRVETTDRRHPPGLPPLLSLRESWKGEVLLLGLEVPPLYRDPETGEVFSRFLRRLQGRLSMVLRRALYDFIRVQTRCKVQNYQALGTRSVPERVWEADRELSAIERAYSFLLLTSPVNEVQAWQRFQADGFQRNPEFHYRLLPVDPDLLRRRLFAVPLEEIDDPALSFLLRDKREELDKQLAMLDERETESFRFSSLRLFGSVDQRLLDRAREVLSSVPPPRPPRREPPAQVDAHEFRDAAAEEFSHYASGFPGFSSEIQIRPDLVGLMVSTGNLLIGEELRLSPGRVDALLQHEVGTHVLTYANGSAQPLGQLALGLADYDELQEGLAVLSEYLVGGLDALRMRLLAARVLAGHSVQEGAEFVETFRLLREECGFSPAGAWGVAVRVHECGGFTRDVIYLRGLVRLLAYLEEGGALEPLYVGKMAQKHIPIIEELRHRGVLREPPLTPRFLERPEARERLDRARRGISLAEMVRTEDA